MTTGSSVPDELIRLSINRSWLRATEELEDEVAAAAEEIARIADVRHPPTRHGHIEPIRFGTGCHSERLTFLV